MLLKLLCGLAAVACVVVLLLAVFSVFSRKLPQLGLLDGQLRPCPESPNCACSEGDPGAASRVPPLGFTQAPDAAWDRLKRAIEEVGGSIEQESDDYLWATFQTKIFRFMDDFEARLDRETGLIHLRSASRVGHSDLGANAKRIEQIRAIFSGGHAELGQD